MAFLANGFAGLLFIITLVCWILVLIRLFQTGRTGVAIASLLLSLCGIGPLVALIYGWLHVDELRVRNIVYLWTACLAAGIILGCAGGILQGQIGLAR